MQKQLLIFTLAASVLILLSFKTSTTTWSSDSIHSRLGFTVTHLGIVDFSGAFNAYEIKMSGDAVDLSDAIIEMSGDAGSINTANEARDKHIKSADFLDVEKFPKFVFKSRSFKKSGKDEYIVKGMLTLHGVTKDIILRAKYKGHVINPANKKEISGFKVTGTFKRSDFMVGVSIPDMVVSDLVTINADLELAKD